MTAEALPSATAHNTSAAALLALFTGAIAIGSSGVFFRLAETGPIATAFWRGALALPVLAVWLALSRSSASATGAWRDARVIWAGVFLAVDLAVWHYSLQLTSVAAATLEVCLAPLAITLYAWLGWRLIPPRRFVSALAAALIGLILIMAPRLGSAHGAITGDLLALGAAGFYAAYLITIARLRARHDTAAVMFLSTLAFTVVLLPLALTQKLTPDTWKGWTTLAGTAVVAHCLGQGLVAYALAHLPATLGSAGIYLQPVAAALYAWLILGEALEPVQMLGAAVTIGAIVLATSVRGYGQDPQIAAMRIEAKATAQRAQ